MKVNYEPLGARVLILADKTPKEQRTTSGIIIAINDAVQPLTTGKIMALGPDVNEVELNDQVSYGLHAGKEMPIGGVVYILMGVRDIEGKFLDTLQK